MKNGITRRDFLKLGGAALLGVPFRPLPPGENSLFAGREPVYRLGRTTQSLWYYAEPTSKSEALGFYNTDAVVRIYQETTGEPTPPHNPIWWRTEDGWLPSSYVQPVGLSQNEPDLDIPPGGFLAEVTVPYTPAYEDRDGRLKQAYRFYYGTTFWVHGYMRNDFGQVWYRIPDDLKAKREFYVLAADLRRVPAAELVPISPGVPNKRIEVDLEGQHLKAFEGDRLVLSTRIATGYLGGSTPIGEHKVESKRPSRHMASMPGETGQYDLPGVPWVCYIMWTGVSIHGTYWHNDYGQPRSHGCINLTPQAAKWIYRWTEPVVPADDNFVESDYGTRVVIY